jgi:hypothetical protein
MTLFRMSGKLSSLKCDFCQHTQNPNWRRSSISSTILKLNCHLRHHLLLPCFMALFLALCRQVRVSCYRSSPENILSPDSFLLIPHHRFIFFIDLYRQENGFDQPPWSGFADRPSPDEAAYPIFVCALEDYAAPGSLLAVPDGREDTKSDLALDMNLTKSLWSYSINATG